MHLWSAEMSTIRCVKVSRDLHRLARTLSIQFGVQARRQARKVCKAESSTPNVVMRPKMIVMKESPSGCHTIPGLGPRGIPEAKQTMRLCIKMVERSAPW
jgi:hypothetical protein